MLLLKTPKLPSMPKLETCCFCIDIRQGTLILAGIGVVSHLYNAVALLSTPSGEGKGPLVLFILLGLYSLVAGLASLGGVVGLLKRDFRLLRFFAYYYAVDVLVGFLALGGFLLYSLLSPEYVCREVSKSPESKVAFETCMRVYSSAMWSLFLSLLVASAVKVHYCLVIWTHYTTLRDQREYRAVPMEGEGGMYLDDRMNPEEGRDEQRV
ncbi:MAG: hypothetical protein DHS80DRAFT_33183 [Piptocephalis tieghemiana]|nr:MAG: hypothetical protein DHS80DRAFT_33183 [Piptocephalis tieghemiana]